MKKILAIGLLALMLLTVVGFSGLVVAQEDAAQDDVAVLQEARLMTTPQGAQVRLHQLHLALERNMARGQDVVSLLEEKAVDTTQLQAMQEQLRLLQEKVQAIEITDEDTSSDVAAQYVALRQEAQELTYQFREQAHSLVSEDDLVMLQEQVQQRAQEPAQEFAQQRKQLHNSIREFNAQQAGVLLQQANHSAQQLQEQIRSHNMSVDQIKTQLRQQLKNCTPQDCSRVAIALQQQRAKQEIFAFQANEDAQGMRQAIRNQLQEHKDDFLRQMGFNSDSAGSGFKNR